MGGWWCEGEDGGGRGGEELWSGRAAFLGGRRWVEDGGVVRLGLAMGSCGEEAWRLGREEVVSDEVGDWWCCGEWVVRDGCGVW